MIEEKAPNYTPAQEALISDFVPTGADGKLTLADATAIACNVAMNDASGNPRKPRSIVAKIVRMSLPYAKQVAKRKDGSEVVTKAQIVEQIALLTGVTFAGLAVAPRGDLIALRDAIAA